MSDNFIIWGSTGHAKVLADLLGLSGKKVLALFDNNPKISSCLRGIPLFYGEVGFLNWFAQLDTTQKINAAVAIGGARGQDRHAIAHKLMSVGLNVPTLIHPSAVVAGSVRYGMGCQILANAVVSTEAIMGEACIINNNANVDHECQLGHGVHIAPGAVLCGSVTVENYAMVGAGAVVLPRLRIGVGAVVGAGAVVTRDVPDGAVVVDNPARPLY